MKLAEALLAPNCIPGLFGTVLERKCLRRDSVVMDYSEIAISQEGGIAHSKERDETRGHSTIELDRRQRKRIRIAVP